MKYKLKQELPHVTLNCVKDILNARGVMDIEKYLYPTESNELAPTLLDNIEQGAELYIKHLENKSKILIVCDADCDGYMSSSMMWLYTKDIYPDADLKYICHEHKAHGVEDVMDYILERDFGLVVIPDAGSSSKELHGKIKASGKDILVIDHHPLAEEDPNAIIINNQSSERYENKTLCGAGVVYKFLQYLDTRLSVDHSKKYLDMCAVGLIGDCMSFKHPETRYYVVEGLKNIYNPGLKALINQQSYSLFKNSSKLTSIGIAFYIAPLINGVVRAGTLEEKRELFHMFIDAECQVQSTKRGAAIGEMVSLGEEMSRVAANIRARQNRTKEKAMELLDNRIQKLGLLDNKIIILEVEPSDKIPQELTGLIAQQFVTKYNRPTMLVRKTAEGYLKGSQRGRANFDEVPDFRAFLLGSGLMEDAPGHANASGVSLLASKKQELLDYANSHISDEGLDSSYMVDYIFSAEECFSELGLELARNESLFGNDIESPTIVVEDVPVSNFRVMGAKSDTTRISYNGIDYMKFSNAEFADAAMMFDSESTITVYGRFAQNTWAGRTTCQVIIDDYEVNEAISFGYSEEDYAF